MKAEYKNKRRSKELIRSAFIDVLDEVGDINQVTVTDIVNVAGINRGTFYNHYSNVMEIANEIENDILEKLKFSAKSKARNLDLEFFLQQLCEFFNENETKYKRLIKNMERNSISKIKQKLIAELSRLELTKDEFDLHYIVSGILGVFLDYIDGTLNIQLNEIAELIAKKLRNNLK